MIVPVVIQAPLPTCIFWGATVSQEISTPKKTDL